MLARSRPSVSDEPSGSGETEADYSASVTDRHGHTRQYGEPNGGFERYPGQGGRPVYERGDGD
jgi:hypothetical protein